MKSFLILIFCIVLVGCTSEQVNKTATIPPTHTQYSTIPTSTEFPSPTYTPKSSPTTTTAKGTITLAPTLKITPTSEPTKTEKPFESWLVYYTSDYEAGGYILNYFAWNSITEKSIHLIGLENEFISDISPDGKRALISGTNTLSIIDFSIGERNEIIKVDGIVSFAKWWHGNPGVIFLLLMDEWGEGAGWAGKPAIVNEDGSGFRLLDNNNIWVYPVISPDGQSIAFSKGVIGAYLYREGKTVLFDMKSYGYSPAKDTYISSPSWSPDGKKLAWMVQTGDNHCAVVFDLENHSSDILQQFYGRWEAGGFYPSPTWSPDGSWLTYSSFSSNSYENGLWLHDLSNQIDDIHLGGNGLFWHPSGKYFIFQIWDQETKENESWLLEVGSWEKRKINLPVNVRFKSWHNQISLPKLTMQPTAKPTSKPTFTRTPMKSANKTPVPSNSILWSDDFNDGNADSWYPAQGEWIVKEDETGNYVYEGTGPVDYPQTWLGGIGDEWKDYAFESRIRIVKGGLFILVRAYQGRYFYNALLPDNGTVSLAKWHNGQYEVYLSTDYKIRKNVWYLVRVEILGQRYSIFIDGKLVASYVHPDESPIVQGGIGYYISGGDKVQIDDVRVWVLK
jgi:hypothetical protein